MARDPRLRGSRFADLVNIVVPALDEQAVAIAKQYGLGSDVNRQNTVSTQWTDLIEAADRMNRLDDVLASVRWSIEQSASGYLAAYTAWSASADRLTDLAERVDEMRSNVGKLIDAGDVREVGSEVTATRGALHDFIMTVRAGKEPPEVWFPGLKEIEDRRSELLRRCMRGLSAVDSLKVVLDAAQNRTSARLEPANADIAEVSRTIRVLNDERAVAVSEIDGLLAAIGRLMPGLSAGSGSSEPATPARPRDP